MLGKMDESVGLVLEKTAVRARAESNQAKTNRKGPICFGELG